MSDLMVRWLGINGFEFQYHGKTLLLDPCVTRGDSPLLSDPQLVRQYITGGDAIFMGHSHWDHLCDVPEIMTNHPQAILYGSDTTLNIARHYRLPEANLKAIKYRDRLDLGHDITVEVFESVHKQPCEVAFYDSVPEKIETRQDFPCAEVFAFLFHFGDISILNIGSANLTPEALRGVECDYLLLGVSRYQPDFPKLCADHLKFRCLIPTHHDEFSHHSLADFQLRDDFIRFRQEITPFCPGLNFLELPVLQNVKLSPAK